MTDCRSLRQTTDLTASIRLAEFLAERAPRRTLRAEDLGIIKGRLRTVGMGREAP